MYKLNLGVGPRPIHPQHLEVMKNLSEWTLVDKYVQEEGYKNWDATNLPIDDNSCSEIYSSHLLEHIPHVDVPKVLSHWYAKLADGGKLTLNVPDLIWACRRLIRLYNSAPLDGYYDRFDGEHGLISIFYGSQSHEGEYHKSGYTTTSLYDLLENVGFKNITIVEFEDAHDMGILFAEAYK